MKSAVVSVMREAERSGQVVNDYTDEHRGAVMIKRIDALDRNMARLCNRIQRLEAELNLTVYGEDSETVIKPPKRKFSPPRSVADVAAVKAVGPETDTKVDKRKTRTYTAEQRQAIADRLRKGREAKAGKPCKQSPAEVTRVQKEAGVYPVLREEDTMTKMARRAKRLASGTAVEALEEADEAKKVRGAKSAMKRIPRRK